jgi:hypothetical protein
MSFCHFLLKYYLRINIQHVTCNVTKFQFSVQIVINGRHCDNIYSSEFVAKIPRSNKQASFLS